MQVAVFWMLGVLFRPPNTLYGLNVGLCFMMMSPRSLARVRSKVAVVIICALPVPYLLFVVTYQLWLETGRGEVNFVYFQCLAYNAFESLLVIEFVGASLRRDKALRLTEKILSSSSEPLARKNADGGAAGSLNDDNNDDDETGKDKRVRIKVKVNNANEFGGPEIEVVSTK